MPPVPIPSLPAPQPASCLVGTFMTHPLDKSNWCWALCTSMILNGTLSPCRIAELALRVSCCPDPPGDPCDQELNDARITRLLRRVSFASVAHHPMTNGANGQVDLATLEDQINVRRTPVLLGVTWKNGKKGHVVLACGVDDTPTGKVITICDPDMLARSAVYWPALQSKYRDGVWDATWILNPRA